MENHYIPEEVIWEEYEAGKIAKSAIETAIWEAEYTEYVHALAKQEAFNLNQDRDIQSFGEADICIKIAQWRAKNMIEKQEYEDLRMDAYIQLRDMISLIQLENGLLIDPREERMIIGHYNRPRRLRKKFRSQALDILLANTIARAKFQNENSYKIRQMIFPYLPPYDNNPR